MLQSWTWFYSPKLCICIIVHTVFHCCFADSNTVNTNLRLDVNPREYESVKSAMEKLEDRFTRTMKEVADLTDEKQKLEHLVLQLQGETETIG